MTTYAVVGSGPTGVAAALALLERGRTVVMLDVGHEAADDASGFPKLPQSDELPRKLVMGSDHPYRLPRNGFALSSAGVGLSPSFAKGGLSRVWGGAMLPYNSTDLRGWPLAVGDLAPHYRAALGITRLSASDDALAERYPVYAAKFQPAPANVQGDFLGARLARHRAALAARGVHVGRSRLALGADCRVCRRCMSGCPHGQIFDARDTLAELVRHPRFSYQSGILVTHVAEAGDTVSLRGRRGDGSPWSAAYERAFLACGVIPSTAIMLASTDRYDHPVRARDSQYFVVPMLMAQGFPGIDEAPLMTLAQHFLELDGRGGEAPVHLQLYGFNEYYWRPFERVPWRRTAVMHRALAAVVGRLAAIQGYLHSDDSGSVAITLRRGDGLSVELASEVNEATARRVSAVRRRLFRMAPRLGAVPIPFAGIVGTPGRGFHSGGTMPMRRDPGQGDTDLLGRPHGFARTHVVDASVFPSVPAATITLTAMANAHRIASQAP